MDENMKKLLENEELMTGLVECTTPAELGELFDKNNIKLAEGISLEEAFKIIKDQENRELDETELDAVSGGIALTLALGCVAVCTLAGAELCFLGGYAYQTYKNYKKSRKK